MTPDKEHRYPEHRSGQRCCGSSFSRVCRQKETTTCCSFIGHFAANEKRLVLAMLEMTHEYDGCPSASLVNGSAWSDSHGLLVVSHVKGDARVSGAGDRCVSLGVVRRRSACDSCACHRGGGSHLEHQTRIRLMIDSICRKKHVTCCAVLPARQNSSACHWCPVWMSSSAFGS